jgi:hypothetical protein
MDAYWKEFGETLDVPAWGATLDAGTEDKEATWGLMGAALETYASTRDARHLQMAKDAADLTLTWMYFHDVGLYFRSQSPLLHDHVNTVGWTFISTQNQEIDLFGYYMAPDYYRLGLITGDERYKQIGRVLFDACTQTISRPGAMFGPVPGIQAEHYNQTNCTYVGGQPDTWRGGSQLTLGIGWITSAALYGGNRLAEMAPAEFPLNPQVAVKPVLRYEFPNHKITIDGNTADWDGIYKKNIVANADHLWFGQGMTPDKWRGNQDLSFCWRGAWDGDKLYFLIAVEDDCVVDPPQQPKTWLNDCIEIHIDPMHLRGPRKEMVNGKERLRGYEMHFLPLAKPVMMVDDLLAPEYPMDKPQNELFKKLWAGEMAVKRTPTGYIAEIAFSVPGVKLQLGKTLGLDVAVCDDDGQSRKALQIWSGNRGEFWKTMDDHPVITLVEKSVNAPAGLRKLLDSYLRDTSICVGPDGTWYMTGTSDPPNGIRVWKSNDPEHAKWEALGLVWQPGASPWHQPYMKDKCPLWAPEIHYLKGNFWLTYSMPGWGGWDPKNSGCGLLKSTSGKPEGPYDDVQPNARLGDEIDASLFEDDDGTVYYLWHNSKIAKMKPDMSGLAEPYRWLKTSVADRDPKHHGWACGSVCQDMNHVCYEGISMFKTNDLYYWCGSEAYDDRYSCSIATSKTIYGPYSERYEALPYCGHNNIFQDKDKQWWATFFGQNGIPWGEKPGILPVTIGADGVVRPK